MACFEKKKKSILSMAKKAAVKKKANSRHLLEQETVLERYNAPT